MWSTAVFALGLAVRVALLVLFPSDLSDVGGEPFDIARSLATSGTYADAYGAGVGPTAHSSPLHPLLLSVLFRIFGTGETGVMAMNIAASAAAAAAFACLPAIAVASGIGLFTGVLAGLAGALVPVNYWPQTSGVFDAPFTSFALMGLCLLLCRALISERFSRTDAVLFGVAGGLGALLNPAILPALALWGIVCAVLYRSRSRQVLAFFAIAALCVVLVLAPWAIRNDLVLGSPIFTRSNFGLELQVSNNDTMTADLEANVRQPEFGSLHPGAGPAERAKVRAMGEVAYHRAKLQTALKWIAGHKQRFLELTAQRFALFWLPHMKRRLQWALEAAAAVGGLAGLVLLFLRREPFAWIASAALLGFSAVYYLIQVSPRYRFPVEPLLFLLSAHFLTGTVLSGLPKRLIPSQNRVADRARAARAAARANAL